MGWFFPTYLLLYNVVIYLIRDLKHDAIRNQVEPFFSSCLLKLTAAGGGSPEFPRKRGSENIDRIRSNALSAMQMLSLDDDDDDSYELESSLVGICQSLRESIDPRETDEVSSSGLEEMIRNEIISERGSEDATIHDKDVLKKLKEMKKKYYRKWEISQETSNRLESLLSELEKKQSSQRCLDKDDIRAVEERILKTSHEIEALSLIKSALERRYKTILDVEREINIRKGRSHTRSSDPSRHQSVSSTRKEQRHQHDSSSEDSDPGVSHTHGSKSGASSGKYGYNFRGLTGKRRHRRKKSTV
ncbi:hypothetical protein FG379_000168 [Cryptosporidium bovis]|uniref:uncharacterized protein n=1 Tax=Cryptosporidium bovis TaxID=310047 RepID=UPI00351A70F0|nr:hypothetical protein FG379_000168 [Cryptosporidium bovis]